MASTASVKSIIESIVSAGTNGITVKELTEKFNCTRATIYNSISLARRLKRTNKKHLYSGEIVSVDNKYYHNPPTVQHQSNTTVKHTVSILNRPALTEMLLNEIKTIPVEYIITYLETREKSIIYESTASILKEITSIFENLRGNYAKKTN